MTTKDMKVRTRGGICLGDRIPIKGKRAVRIVQGKKQEDLLPEDLVEAITGKQVAVIIYRDDFSPGID